MDCPSGEALGPAGSGGLAAGQSGSSLAGTIPNTLGRELGSVTAVTSSPVRKNGSSGLPALSGSGSLPDPGIGEFPCLWLLAAPRSLVGRLDGL